MERGESNPSFQVMEQVTSALGVSMKDLFDFEHNTDSQNLRKLIFDIIEQLNEKEMRVAYKILKSIYF